MLEWLFESGGDPNCEYVDGAALFASFDLKYMTKEMLQAWLNHGANPTNGERAFAPFGGSTRLPALHYFVKRGRLDLVQQACEKALAPIPLTYERDGHTYAPLLAMAFSLGHSALAE